ncbi:MAG: trypsin-like peptidase domain-containing protein [Acidimicrobiaceae bacterium]|nr:trypsin-like peptidase domain-containing protein [Acidimicrobiaceae bacterium]MDE0496999.1 trypsin-like peptidase domain-containing protein [Acidimicrobiaceae bacterium]
MLRSAESAPPLTQTGLPDTAAAQAGEPASSETVPARDASADGGLAVSVPEGAVPSPVTEPSGVLTDPPASGPSIPEQAPPPTSLASASTALDSLGTTAESPEVPPTSAPRAPAEPDEVDWEQLSRSVVQLQSTECGQAGSGIIIGNGDLVLTNSHVVRSESNGRACGIVVGFTSRFDKPPDGWQPATLVADDPGRDLAVVQIAGAAPAGHPSLEVQRDDLALGEEITTLGYPGFGHSQDTLTFTAGRFSGTTVGDGYELLKTDALLDAGASGGGVFDAQGRLIGLAVGGFEGEGGYLGLVIGGSEVLRFLARHDLL